FTGSLVKRNFTKYCWQMEEAAANITRTTLEELKETREQIRTRRDRFEKKIKLINNDGSSDLRNQTSNQRANYAIGFDTRCTARSSSTSVTGTTAVTTNSKEPSCVVYEKLILDYFANNLHCDNSFPIDSYGILKRLASWQVKHYIPFTQTSLNNLESALKILSTTWGPSFISIKDNKLSEKKRLIVEEVDFTKLNMIKVIESSLDLEKASLEKVLLSSTSTVNNRKRRKIEDTHEEDSAVKQINELLSKPTFNESQETALLHKMSIMLNKKSAQDKLIIDMFRSTNNSFREFCVHGTKSDCCKIRKASRACKKLHFRPMIRPHTELELGDCSYLNTCHRMDTCKYVHYELDDEEEKWTYIQRKSIPPGVVFIPPTKVLPPQWINCDVRKFDFSILGKFTVIMADPPWDIHMTLPYGTMTDDEMKAMAISDLQDEGLLFLWVTGRAMELGRECLTIWGYQRADELVWIKTNQLQRLIRTGRTGHWLNHSKEHCLVGIKGNPADLNRGLDCDVLVGEVRETSRKPDEIYGIIDRLVPGTRKLEIFGRKHNTRPGWMTLGNQLEDVRLYEPELVARFNERYPDEPCELTQLPEDW
ncbi:6752_t:CDS:10, partial [Acaulospora morrowiae]